MVDPLPELIQRVVAGDVAARDALFSGAYPELRKLARSRLYGGGRNTFLATTALVHETYLRFLQAGQLDLAGRRAFFAYASTVMRSVVIDSVREHLAERRGGNVTRLTLDTRAESGLPQGQDEILEVQEALLALEAIEPRLAKVVEMRYFGGFLESEIAEALEVTERTVRRDWEKARLLLAESMKS